MANYYVWTPFIGTLMGQDCYCYNCAGGGTCTNSLGACTSCGSSQCVHNTGINGLCCPVDIFGSANTAVWLYTSVSIKSIRTTRTGPNNNGDALCATAPPAGFEWVNEGVRVRLYTGLNGGGNLVGTVFYGHLRNRIANGLYNDPSNLNSPIGYLGDQNCACACYDGIHVHMERSSANSGYTYHHYCGYPLGSNSVIYRWTL